MVELKILHLKNIPTSTKILHLSIGLKKELSIREVFGAEVLLSLEYIDVEILRSLLKRKYIGQMVFMLGIQNMEKQRKRLLEKLRHLSLK